MFELTLIRKNRFAANDSGHNCGIDLVEAVKINWSSALLWLLILHHYLGCRLFLHRLAASLDMLCFHFLECYTYNIACNYVNITCDMFAKLRKISMPNLDNSSRESFILFLRMAVTSEMWLSLTDQLNSLDILQVTVVVATEFQGSQRTVMTSRNDLLRLLTLLANAMTGTMTSRCMFQISERRRQ